METLNTIANNAEILWNAPIDWSPTAGPIWLLGTTVIMAVWGALALSWADRQARKDQRQALYREAQLVAARRSNLMDVQGYVDTRSF